MPAKRSEKKLAGPGMAEIRRAETLESWEDQLLDWLFSRHRVARALRNRIREEQLERVDGESAVLEAWNEAFPDYPVWYGATIIRHIDKQCPLSLLMCQMSRSALVRKFEAFEEEVGEGRSKPLALIVRWPNLVRRGEISGALVLHDGEPEWSVPGTRITWVYNEPECGKLTLQPLSLLVKEIDVRSGGRWRPEGF